MSLLSDAKALGGVGSILVLFTPVPSVGWLLGIAGLVMILAAISKISQVVGDKSIYGNMQNAVILAIGAIAVGAVTIVGTIYHVLGMGSFANSRFVLGAVHPADFFGLAALVIAGVLAVWALLVTSSIFVRKSFKSIGSRLGVGTFETAGLLYIIGAATAIVFVGFILIFIAEILLVVSFFSIPEQSIAPQGSQVPTIPSTG
jgi:uncharacterized membrane protein